MFATERPNEGAPQSHQHGAGDGIGAVFMLGDAAAGLRHAGAAFQQVAQGDRPVHQGAGMIIELREEFLLARHQCLEKTQHGHPLIWAPACNDGTRGVKRERTEDYLYDISMC